MKVKIGGGYLDESGEMVTLPEREAEVTDSWFSDMMKAAKADREPPRLIVADAEVYRAYMAEMARLK